MIATSSPGHVRRVLLLANRNSNSSHIQATSGHSYSAVDSDLSETESHSGCSLYGFEEELIREVREAIHEQSAPTTTSASFRSMQSSSDDETSAQTAEDRADRGPPTQDIQICRTTNVVVSTNRGSSHNRHPKKKRGNMSRNMQKLNDILEMELLYNGEKDVDDNKDRSNDNHVNPCQQQQQQKKKLRFAFDKIEFHEGIQGLTLEEWHNCWYSPKQMQEMEDAVHAAVKGLREQQKKQNMEQKFAVAEREHFQKQKRTQQQQQQAGPGSILKSFSLKSIWVSSRNVVEATTDSAQADGESESHRSQAPPHPIAILEVALSTCQEAETEADMEQISRLLKQEQKRDLLTMYGSGDEAEDASLSRTTSWRGGFFMGGSSRMLHAPSSSNGKTDNQENMQNVLGLEPFIWKASRGTSLEQVRKLLKLSAFKTRTRKSHTRRVQNQQEHRREEKRAQAVQNASRVSRLLAHELALVLHETPQPQKHEQLKESRELAGNTTKPDPLTHLIFSEPGTQLGLHIDDDSLEVVGFNPPFLAYCDRLGLVAESYRGAKVVSVHHEPSSQQHSSKTMSVDEIWAALKDPSRPKTVLFRLQQ